MNDTGDTGSDVIVIFGGRSEIGTELAVRLAPGSTVVLTTRDGHSLDQQVSALRAAGAVAVHVKGFDADDLTSHAAVLDEIITEHGPIGTGVLAFGILGDQARAETDAGHAVSVVHTDYVAQVNLLTLLAQRMREAGRGRMVVFSSVAGGPSAQAGSRSGAPTTCTARRKRVSTGSPAGWPTPCTVPVCTC